MKIEEINLKLKNTPNDILLHEKKENNTIYEMMETLHLLYEDEGLIDDVKCIDFNANFIPSIQFNYKINKQLIRIVIYNNTKQMKYIHIGVKNGNMYHIQNNHYFITPKLVTLLELSPHNRVSIMLDLTNFEDFLATLFFYNFDCIDDIDNIKYYNNDLPYIEIPFLTIKGNFIPDLNLGYSMRNLIIKQIKKYNDYEINHKINYPTRNMIIFRDKKINNISEFIDGELRIFVDLWNSNQLTKTYDINSKPEKSPECLFKIDSTNETLLVEIFDQPVKYDDIHATPIGSSSVLFPVHDFVDIDVWIFTIFERMLKTKISLKGKYEKLATILNVDWSYYPLKIEENLPIINTIIFKLLNRTSYHIRLSGSSKLMQFFGKSIGLSNDIHKLTCDCDIEFFCETCFNKQNPIPIKNKNTKVKRYDKFHDKDDFSKMKDKKIINKCRNYINVHIHNTTTINSNTNINDKNVFKYATKNLPITTKHSAEIIIEPNTTFTGFIDGSFNENFLNVNCKNNTVEKWTIYNVDSESHLLHLSNGFILLNSEVQYESKNDSDEISRTKEDNSLDTISENINKEIRNTLEIDTNENMSFYIKFNNSSKYYISDHLLGQYRNEI